MPTTLSRLWGALALLVLSGPLGAASDAVPTVKRLDRSTVQVQGVQVAASAYFDHSYGPPTASRYAVRIKSKPTGPLRWELYNPLWGLGDSWGNQDIIGQESVTPYRRHQRQALITCQLRQYDEMEERVTFHDLTLTRVMGFGFLTVSKPLTETTPSGVKVTLPVQNQETFMPGGSFSYNGPPDMVFARVGLSPGGKRNALPASPLYQRHRVPVSIRVDVAAPVFMNSNSGDSALPQITLSLRDPKATYVPSLTLVIHQRADLQSIPLAFRVPIARRAPRELFAGQGG